MRRCVCPRDPSRPSSTQSSQFQTFRESKKRRKPRTPPSPTRRKADMARSSAPTTGLPGLLLPLLTTFTCLLVHVHADLLLLPGYTATPLTPELQKSFLDLVSLPTSYASTVSKRICVFSLDSASMATYANVQLNFRVTGCDIKDALMKQKILPTKAVIADNLGMCSDQMVKICATSTVKASIEVIEKTPTMIWYISYDTY